MKIKIFNNREDPKLLKIKQALIKHGKVEIQYLVDIVVKKEEHIDLTTNKLTMFPTVRATVKQSIKNFLKQHKK